MYAMVCTRPNIAHVVRVVSRYMNNLGKEHWKEVQWILNYLRGIGKQYNIFLGIRDNDKLPIKIEEKWKKKMNIYV